MTWHNGPNAGTFFQLYGLYQELKTRGHDVKVIKYKSKPQDFLPKGGFYYISQFLSLIRKKIKDYKDTTQSVSVIKKWEAEIAKRSEKVDSMYKLLDFTNEVSSDAEMKKLNDEFDMFIVGSDQVWNATMLNRRYFLDYVEEGKIKAAFGPSVGTGKILACQRKMYQKYVSRFDYIGVRENLLAETLNGLIDQKVEHVIDPSMLITKEEYRNFAYLPEKYKGVRYLLLYFTLENGFMLNEAKDYAKRNNLKIVCMAMHHWDYMLKDIDIYAEADPREFLGLIMNASAVFTSSFHCTIFSILFNRNLFVFERQVLNDSSDTSLRYKEQLSIYGMEHRLIKYGNKLKVKNFAPIDYQYANTVHKARVERAKRFLDQFC